ncbi:hypothetical protein SAMN03097699_1509 [Flavobacteriaceae bacterium MAR_2010_188]|nr:hypothetical protein SAMN03097699_1509 [Flavobacteriaceae bacterium MAR_2010_188]
MKNILMSLAIVFLISSCKQEIDLSNISGYWEIDKVILEDGSERDYGVNTTVDYIELKSDSTGIRKKLSPRLDGTFSTTEDFESFKIKENNGDLFIQYETPMMSWDEELLNLNETTLEVKNDHSIRYIYKRFEPINLE